jgi:endonuclease/exonuclease/phosphatase family metal-dependent hydrolase
MAFSILLIAFMMFVVACNTGKPSNKDSAPEPAVPNPPSKATTAADQPEGANSLKPMGTGKILIVNANVEEAFPEDIRTQDMRNFVKRMAKVLPNLPDILLLQEVLNDSANEVAQFLTETAGEPYKVVIAPGKNLTVGKDPNLPGEIRADTAILVRSGAFEVVDSGGFIRSSYTFEDAKKYNTKYANSKDHSYAMVKDTRDGTSLALVSVHLHTGNFTTSDEIFTKKAEWTLGIAKFMDEKYPKKDDHTIQIIGGDFNNRRNLPGSQEIYPFWKVLTEQFHYKDAIFEIKEPGEVHTPDRSRIDYIFVNGGSVLGAASDLKYTKEIREDKNQFYSDHHFNWSIIGTKE